MNTSLFKRFYAPEGDTPATGSGDASTVTAGTVSQDNPFVGSPEPAYVEDAKPAETSAPAVTPKVETPAVVTPPAAVTPAAPAALTPEKIAEIAAQAAARVGQKPEVPVAQTPPAAMTQEQFDKTFNVVKLDAAGFTAITGYAPDSPAQVQALNNTLQGVVRQSLTMMQVQVDNIAKQIRAEFTQQVGPIAAEREAAVGKQLQAQFFEKHQDLKQFEALALEVAENLRHSGKKFTSAEEAFNFVAEKTRALIPKGFVAPTTTGTTTPTQQTQQPVQRQMTPTSVGGQVSAPTGSATTRGNDAKSIFG